MTRLTVAAIDKLKVRGVTQRGKGKRGGKQRTRVEYHDGGGLYLIVQASGHKSWAYKYKRNGVSQKDTFATYYAKGSSDGTPKRGDGMSLVEARAFVHNIKLQRNRGVDPIAEHKAAKLKATLSASPTGFAAAARDYIENRCRDEKENRGWAFTAATLGLRYDGDEVSVIPGGLADRWGDRPVAEITEDDVFAVFDEARYKGVPGRVVRNEGQSPARHRDMSAALSGMFRWLKGRRKVAVNPVAGLERPEPPRKRDRVLTAKELRAIWLASDEITTFGPFIKTLILTGARRSEVSGMRRSEIDGSVWTIPGTRTKNKQAHTVPLPKRVTELIGAELRP